MKATGPGFERFSPGAVGLVTLLALALAPAAPAAAGTPAEAASLECKSLLGQRNYNSALARCEESVRLDPKLPEPYYLLGATHDAFWQQKANTPERIQEHRAKALDHYRKSLALNRGDTDERRSMSVQALSALLELVQFGGEQEGDLKYADELARAPSLVRRQRFVLAATYARHSRAEECANFMKQQLDADPKDAQACQMLAGLYNMPVWNGRPRFDDSIATLERCAALAPNDPVGYYVLATFLWDKSYRDPTLADKEKLAYVERGLGHADRALAIDKDFPEAMIYKGLLLRAKAVWQGDPAVRQTLTREAADLQERALALKRAGVPPRAGLENALLPVPPPAPPRPQAAPQMPPPPPPPPPRRVGSAPRETTGGLAGQPVRVGGAIKEPRKLKDVRPEYPSIAKEARVQGVVILECTISPEGTVADARVLRGIPLLDQAAIAAVKQWIYQPTLLNGEPVPVIMTVTVNFTLS
jgi:TonB family protein